MLLKVKIGTSILIRHSREPRIRRLPVSTLIERSLEPDLMKLESLLYRGTALCDLSQVTSSLWQGPKWGKAKQMYISSQFNKNTVHLPKLKNKGILWLLRLSFLWSNRTQLDDWRYCCDVSLPVFDSWPDSTIAVHAVTWANYLVFLCLTFFIYKMVIAIVLRALSYNDY